MRRRPGRICSTRAGAMSMSSKISTSGMQFVAVVRAPQAVWRRLLEGVRRSSARAVRFARPAVRSARQGRRQNLRARRIRRLRALQGAEGAEIAFVAPPDGLPATALALGIVDKAAAPRGRQAVHRLAHVAARAGGLSAKPEPALRLGAQGRAADARRQAADATSSCCPRPTMPTTWPAGKVHEAVERMLGL